MNRMGKLYYRIGFSVETAKQIQNGELEGEIETKGGWDVRIVCTDMQKAGYPILACVNVEGTETAYSYNEEGRLMAGDEYDDYSLILWVADKPMYNHKKYDVVLVRNSDADAWMVSVFSHRENRSVVTADLKEWSQCMPFNEETMPLIGTTCPVPESKKKWEVGKMCKKCKHVKPLSAFSRKADSEDGLQGHCKQCYKEYRQRNNHEQGN